MYKCICFVKNTDVLSINEGSSAGVFTEYKAKRNRSLDRAEAVFEPGQLSVTKTVSIIYSIR